MKSDILSKKGRHLGTINLENEKPFSELQNKLGRWTYELDRKWNYVYTRGIQGYYVIERIVESDILPKKEQ